MARPVTIEKVDAWQVLHRRIGPLGGYGGHLAGGPRRGLVGWADQGRLHHAQ